MAKGTIDAGTLSATGSTEDVFGDKCDVILSGTWTGTVKLQIYANDAWVDTQESWTSNDTAVAESATPNRWRLDWTKTSGSLVYTIKAMIAGR